MEEVDNIIIHTLRSIGCDVDEEVISLHQFSAEIIVEAVASCLKVINNDLEIPRKLPPSMSARFRVGTSLASAVQELGYSGDIGYQTFLYSTESDIRRLFMFLIEKLPKESVESGEEALGGSGLLQRAIACEVSRLISLPWTPHYCKPRGGTFKQPWHLEGCSQKFHFHTSPLSTPQGLHDITRKVPADLRTYYSNNLAFISEQPGRHRDVLASVMQANSLAVTAQQEYETEWNHLGLSSKLSPEAYKERKRQRIKKKIAGHLREQMKEKSGTEDLDQLLHGMSERSGAAVKTKGSRFTHIEKLQYAQDEEKAIAQMGVGEGPKVDTEKDLQEKRENELEELHKEMDQLTSKLHSLEAEIKKYKASSVQMEEEIKTCSAKNEEKEESYKVKKRTMDLLPDAENNITKLQNLVDSSGQRLLSLAEQWEKHRVPLIEKYRELKEQTEGRVSETEIKLEELKEVREKMKSAAAETRGKEEFYKQLVSEYERMAKDVNRSAYTRRILEIVSNIKRQKTEIDRVLLDTKAVQKEINQLSGKLDRTFTVSDELIFRDAKKDESVRKAYKFLAALHENCTLLIKIVEETGVITREIRDLEDQIEQESTRKILANLEKITEDYQMMKKENSVMLAKLKKHAVNHS